MDFSGAITAMVTPFQDGMIDEPRLRDQVEFQIDKGISALCPCGTTGESPTLTHTEHDRVIELVIEYTAGRVPVVAGAGSNSTAEALRLSRHALEAGASATLQVCPYYNKPTQEGLFRHYMTLAENVELPHIIYNIPGRSAVQISTDTIVRLAEHPNIAAVKEATGSIDVASELAARCGDKLSILSGDDSLTLPIIAVGGVGVISVLSNLIPDRIERLARTALSGDYESARRQHLELFPLFRGMFVETNPIPIKWAMKMLERDSAEYRLPLSPPSAETQKRVEALLREYGLFA